MKFIFLTVYFDIKGGEGKDSKCLHSFVQGCRKVGGSRSVSATSEERIDKFCDVNFPVCL